jgi:hypothetical protein
MAKIEPDPGFAAHLKHDIEYVFTSPTTAYSRVWHDEDWVGIHEYHVGVAGMLCYGFVAFDTPEARAVTTEAAPKWEVQSWDPLTLAPSLLCTHCRHHGFLRQGEWEDC